MNAQHGKPAWILTCALAAWAAVAWAAPLAPAGAAAHKMASAVGALGARVGQATGAARLASSWGRAIEVPGLGAMNKGGGPNLFVGVSSVSCGAAGSCAAGGYYTDRHHHRQGFVAAERHGRWRPAIEKPGPGALNRVGGASVSQVSCGAAGNCAAGGSYTDRRHHRQGFVAAERRGRWGPAIKVPGLAALNTGGNAGVSAVSCPSAGNCTAAGDYKDQAGHTQGFVAAERHGRWGPAIKVPGLGTLNTGGRAGVSAVSCPSAGNCTAAGDYKDQAGGTQGFVVSQRNGRWRTAIDVPGLAALNTGGDADVSSVSCGTAGNCAAVGTYYVRNNDDGPGGFAVSQQDGRWTTAITLPGLRPAGDVDVEVDSVSCTRAHGCAAVGTAGEAYGTGFVAVKHHSRWGNAESLILGGRFSGADSVACGTAGNCAAGGLASDDTGGVVQGAVVIGRHGGWAGQTGVPGLRALNKGGYAAVITVACPPAGRCVAGGYYLDRRGHFQAFVTY